MKCTEKKAVVNIEYAKLQVKRLELRKCIKVDFIRWENNMQCENA